ncbi:hypothetical protein [Bradyrhizobium sp. BWC-3-1]|uniref:hypothetical protein n=1 Tax=Bradyrhizobium sp. BWC-3-1 TaxID=3080012 RepID=UPI00293F17B5|nr:hypothetical protein [Bradyrhizobium sp. BWC-3-1]WOH59913.1 hypothetical protein RX329_07250 [Bradyrhizobium sp. BWC-3-1]
MTQTFEELYILSSSLANNDHVWNKHHFIWKKPMSWMPQLTAWLGPRMRANGLRRLKPGVFRDLCWDDSEWLRVLEKGLAADLEYHTANLAEAIETATIRTYHGCRTADAGVYHREGLRKHDRAALKQQLHAIVEAHSELQYLRKRLPEAIAQLDDNHEEGLLYVVADDQALVNEANHYLIYGSEWISAVLGYTYRHVLKETGVPTLLEIDLPLRIVSLATRTELAAKMLREWTRLTCNQPDWSAPIDFTFMLRASIPPEWIVGHSHPETLKDSLDSHNTYRSPSTHCEHCKPY